ncbi:site-specific integrase [Streptomyces reniochalinae]|uniref:Site-specific integrase n=1 Tax=Streptomyces reniochalinae TaxID=2250578 RepID=A0A367ELT0_9ACTN|nr:site-specific integrase [Streptomyces reniochalinae]
MASGCASHEGVRRAFVQEWLETISGSDGTWENYERIWRLHVLPQLGRKLLSQVTAADIERLYNLWRTQGAEPNTIESRRIALSSAFTRAARHKRIATNPAKEALAPEHHIVPVDERALPSLEEVSAIAESIGPRLGPAIGMMASCGLRIGETLGLSSQDFDTDMLRLRRQVVRTARGGRYAARYAPLKHRKEGEWRDVPLPEPAFSLAPYFPILSESGTIPYPDLLRKSWNRAIRRLGMRPCTPHDLRHKWATVTLTNGVSIHEVSRWLGHRSIKVTVDRYGHLTQDGRERCRQVVSAVYADHLPAGSGQPVLAQDPALSRRRVEGPVDVADPTRAALDLAVGVLALGAQPDVLPLPPLVDVADRGVVGGSGVVGDDVAVPGETDDGHQVS